MKWRMIVTVAALAAVSFLSSFAIAQQKHKVLLIAREAPKYADLDLMIDKEVAVMRNLLSQAGFEVVVASVSGQPLVGSSKTLTPDLKLGEVKTADYVGFIIPCLVVDSELPADFAASLKTAMGNGKPVAAQSCAVGALAKAGFLSGKKYAFIRDRLSLRMPSTVGMASFRTAS
ncbi:MAG: DJ-1/PfpI family protein [Acidobacteriota bacterium]|jgi:putative intracellular protease/amidase